MNKRAIIILTAMFLLIVGTLGFLLYSRQVGNNQNETVQQTDNDNQVSNQNQNLGNDNQTDLSGQISWPLKLLDDNVVSPILFFRGNGVSYFDNAGKFYQVDLDTAGQFPVTANKKTVELPEKPSLYKVLWPQTSNNFIAESLVAGKRAWSFYDSSKKLYVDLPLQIMSLDWMPDALKIVYVWQGSNGKNTLNISNPDGSGYGVLADMYYADSEISVSPDGKNILFFRTQNTGDVNPITLVSSDGKFFKTQVKDGYNMGVAWAPDSKQFVFTRKDPQTQNFNLWIGSIQSEAVKNLNTLGAVEKVVWSSDSSTLYVASNMQGRETIYKINPLTGEKMELASGGNFGAVNLFLSLDGKFLFFKNTADGGLYSVMTTVSSSGLGGSTTGSNSSNISR